MEGTEGRPLRLSQLATHPLAAQGAPIPDADIQSFQYGLLLDEINEHWQAAGRGVTLAVMLSPTPSDTPLQPLWVGTGTALCERLLALGTWYGIYLDSTDLAPSMVERWDRAAMPDAPPAGPGNSGAVTGIADLTLASRPQDPGPSWRTETVRCCLFQSARFGAWLSSLWADTVPNDFFQPGLVLAVYDGNVTKGMDSDSPLTEATFVGTLGRAVAWLMPYGDPPIFVVGVPMESGLYGELTAGGR